MTPFGGEVSIFRGICRKIKLDVINGVYTPGDQVPTVRALAEMLSINPNTVQRALSELEREGLLESRGTTGRFITSDIGLIEEMCRKVKEEYVSTTLEKAKELAITKEEFIRLIEEFHESPKIINETSRKEDTL